MQSYVSPILAAALILAGGGPAFAQSEGDLRLVDGANPRIGRLEIFHAGQWGTICDDFFDDTDAGVACRQLGYDAGVDHQAYGWVFPGVDPIWMDNVSCSGAESSLASCAFNGWGLHNCIHTEDVGVHCSGCPSTPEPGCQTGWAKAKLVISEKVAGKERLTLSLAKGPALDRADLGDPLGTDLLVPFFEPAADYSLCVYDDADALVGTIDVAGSTATCGSKACWKDTGPSFAPTGLVYKDAGLLEDGVAKMILKSGASGKPKLVIKGKNNLAKGLTNLPSMAPGLAGSTAATVQVYTDEAGCFSAMLSNVVKNDPTLFKATN